MIGASMQVKINGKSEDVQGATVLDLLKAKNIDPHMVAVELNAQMVERDNLGTTAVKENDQLEFLFYMGGGRT
jgi:sulfur carrier protein